MLNLTSDLLTPPSTWCDLDSWWFKNHWPFNFMARWRRSPHLTLIGKSGCSEDVRVVSRYHDQHPFHLMVIEEYPTSSIKEIIYKSGFMDFLCLFKEMFDMNLVPLKVDIFFVLVQWNLTRFFLSSGLIEALFTTQIVIIFTHKQVWCTCTLFL